MNILLTSAGRRTYLVNYFKGAFNGQGLVHASNSVMTYTLSQADRYIVTPPIYDGNYIDFVLNYCKQEYIKAIIPLFDIDLPILAKNKELFRQNGIEVIVSDPEVIRICNDKWSTYNHIKSLRLSQPTSFLSIENLEKALKAEVVSFPVILKPRWGMGSIGLYQVDNVEELYFFYKKLKREIFHTYLKFESKEDEESCIILQEKIIGTEYGLDIFNDLQGNNVAIIPKEKIAMRAGETDIARIDYKPQLVKLGQTIANSLHHIGNLDLDCFLTPNGEVVVLEMNCRFGGQYPFSHVSGANFPRQIIEWLNGGRTDLKLLQAEDNTMACKELLPIKI